MPLRILIAPDKFKGTLGARPAAEAIARGWRAGRPQDALQLLPISDGGDGFGEILSGLLGAEPRRTRAADAAHRPLEAPWWWHAGGATAVIESAGIIGLALLPPGRFHPFELDTAGLGAVLREAAAQGARRCLVGIGGSATNDAGFGLARALGWQFCDVRGSLIGRWTELHRLAVAHPPDRPALFEDLVVAVDVRNPLLGPEGCTRVYGPQKGLRCEDFDLAERCLSRLAEVLRQQFHRDHAADPGAGAAGGLGFGLRSFAGARLEPGFGLFALHADLAGHLASCDLVLTGEGALDQQTLMGKGVGELAQWCQRAQVPCVALAGTVNLAEASAPLFAKTYALTPGFVPRERALSDTAGCLAELAARAAQEWIRCAP